MILYGAKQIAAQFGVKKCRVKEWKRAGAPIIQINSGNGSRYRADYMELYKWLWSGNERDSEKPSSF